MRTRLLLAALVLTASTGCSGSDDGGSASGTVAPERVSEATTSTSEPDGAEARRLLRVEVEEGMNYLFDPASGDKVYETPAAPAGTAVFVRGPLVGVAVGAHSTFYDSSENEVASGVTWDLSTDACTERAVITTATGTTVIHDRDGTSETVDVDIIGAAEDTLLLADGMTVRAVRCDDLSEQIWETELVFVPGSIEATGPAGSCLVVLEATNDGPGRYTEPPTAAYLDPDTGELAGLRGVRRLERDDYPVVADDDCADGFLVGEGSSVRYVDDDGTIVWEREGLAAAADRHVGGQFLAQDNTDGQLITVETRTGRTVGEHQLFDVGEYVELGALVDEVDLDDPAAGTVAVHRGGDGNEIAVLDTGARWPLPDDHFPQPSSSGERTTVGVLDIGDRHIVAAAQLFDQDHILLLAVEDGTVIHELDLPGGRTYSAEIRTISPVQTGEPIVVGSQVVIVDSGDLEVDVVFEMCDHIGGICDTDREAYQDDEPSSTDIDEVDEDDDTGDDEFYMPDLTGLSPGTEVLVLASFPLEEGREAEERMNALHACCMAGGGVVDSRDFDGLGDPYWVIVYWGDVDNPYPTCESLMADPDTAALVEGCNVRVL